MEYIYTDNPIDDSSVAVLKSIKQHLDKGELVLWLVSGGSSTEIAVKVSQQLKNCDLSKLSISLTDERYGPTGHKDENWQQLLDQGLLLTGSNTYRPLKDKDIETTTTEFNSWIKKQLEKADYKIGIFGMGADGHTAGIKPHTSNRQSNDLVYSYSGDDFERVTISFKAIEQMDKAVIQISGNNKKPALKKLLHSDASAEQQPAQILKTIPNATIYSNINEEDIK